MLKQDGGFKLNILLGIRNVFDFVDHNFVREFYKKSRLWWNSKRFDVLRSTICSGNKFRSFSDLTSFPCGDPTFSMVVTVITICTVVCSLIR